jgi:hypothetical protein
MVALGTCPTKRELPLSCEAQPRGSCLAVPFWLQSYPRSPTTAKVRSCPIWPTQDRQLVCICTRTMPTPTHCATNHVHPHVRVRCLVASNSVTRLQKFHDIVPHQPGTFCAINRCIQGMPVYLARQRELGAKSARWQPLLVSGQQVGLQPFLFLPAAHPAVQKYVPFLTCQARIRWHVAP